MYRCLAVVVMVAACSSDTTPNGDVEVDASSTGTSGEEDGGDTSDTSASETETTLTTDTTSDGSDTSSETEADTTSEGTETSGTSSSTNDDDGGVSGNAPDADVDTDGGLAQCEPLGETDCDPGFDCAVFSEAGYSQAVEHAADRCGEFVYQSMHTGEGCGYLILKYAFGAGDTFMAFYDKDSHDVVGWKFMDDTNRRACAGEVPAECYEYGLNAPPNGVNLCPDAGAPDASADGSAPDAEALDANAPANIWDANLPDASPFDGSVDASDVE